MGSGDDNASDDDDDYNDEWTGFADHDDEMDMVFGGSDDDEDSKFDRATEMVLRVRK